MVLSFVRQVFYGFYSKLFPRKIQVDFRKKAVFITGCDTGLGYNFALHLHSKGVKVFAGVLNDLSPGAKALIDQSISVVNVDITDSSSIEKASSLIRESISQDNYDFFGLVNNAGIMVVGEFEWQTESMISKQISVNLLGPMNIIKHFLPVLRQQNGRIVNVSSHCAGFPLPGMTVYSASKAGLRALSLGLNHELDKFGIRVVELVPGSFIMQSCIMSNQKEHSSSMLDKMSDEVKHVYKDYFNRYTGYLASLPVPSSLLPPQSIDDAKLYSKLECALFSCSPRSVYVNEPPRYFLYYTLFSCLPECSIKHYLVKKFIKMPEWNENK